MVQYREGQKDDKIHHRRIPPIVVDKKKKQDEALKNLLPEHRTHFHVCMYDTVCMYDDGLE